jgi:hypothetical protein
MKLRDKYGWPVVTIEGFHPIINTIRYLIHTSIKKTWTLRRREQACPWDVIQSGDVQCTEGK